MNERIIEDVVREDLKSKGYAFEEQISTDLILKKLLKSKTGGKGHGRPEFIINELWDANSVLVIECKGDITKHESSDRDKIKDYAVDGVLHYAKNLTLAGRNVVALAVSGDDKQSILSTFYCEGTEIIEYKINDILTPDNYYKLTHPVKQIEINSVTNTAKSIHNYIRDYLKLTEDEKPKLVAGALIALDNPFFKIGYHESMAGGTLSRQLFNTVSETLKSSGMPTDKAEATISELAFIQHHQALNSGHSLKKFISYIEKDIFPYAAHDHDIVGMFYGEFLKYVGGDGKGLGIVLTPRHITELFCELAQITKDSIVIDTCCGTGGFLIAAMNTMLNKATTENEKINIRKSQLLGVEQAAKMYFLATSNMYLRGDGKANLYLGSCFDEEISKDIKENKRPNIALINPPYSQKGNGLSELHFIKHSLDLLQPNGICVAIVPMSCGIKPSQVKKDILASHTLEACLSMPDELFYPVGVVTCIMIFKAHVPHSAGTKSWFGYLKDDGFIKTRTQGRADINNRWQGIKQQFLTAYKNKETAPGLFVMAEIDANSEWCAEAYLETDYSLLTEKDFKNVLLDYNVWRARNEPL